MTRKTWMFFLAASVGMLSPGLWYASGGQIQAVDQVTKKIVEGAVVTMFISGIPLFIFGVAVPWLATKLALPLLRYGPHMHGSRSEVLEDWEKSWIFIQYGGSDE